MLLPLIALAAGGTVFALREQQVRLRDEAVRRAAEVLDRVERELSTQIELLKVLARSPALDPTPPDLAAFREEAVRFKSELPLWDRVILAAPEGHQLLNTGLPPDFPLPAVVDREGHDKVVATRQAIIGNLAGPGPSQRSPNGMLSVRVPVIHDGAVTHTLVATVRPDRLKDILTSSTGPAFRGFLIDGAGRVVVAPNVPGRVGGLASESTARARAEGGAGVYDGVTPEGTPTVTAYRTSEATGWSAHVALPLDLYQEPIRRAVWLLGAACLSTLVLTGLFIWLLRREIIADRREASARERTARMEALGRMTGGIAHDVNNLLMGVQGNAEVLRLRLRAHGLTEDARLERCLAAIDMAVEKGARMMRDLLVFSRGGTAGQVTTFDPAARIRDNLELIRHSLRGDIDLRLDLAPGLLVRVDPVLLDLALLNLAANARDAMPSGGTLRILLRRAPASTPSEPPAVELSVEDNGAGIPAESLPHVFEPFFTTKDLGKGTGLGLSQVYGFASAAGGTASVASTVGAGTTVTVRIPEAAPSPAPELPGDVMTVRGLPPGLRVILAEDNDDVRQVIADVLTESGCEVRQFTDAASALDAIGQGVGDVLVSDIRMPGPLDGLGLAKRLRDERAGFPVILMSGYSEMAAEAVSLGIPLIPKPFDRTSLLDALRRETAGRAVPALP
nr:ATP-binding protein [Azospirillum sp. SYSU D00513]